MTEAAPDRFAPGSILADRYRIERRLGEGAVGVVYLAEHIHLGEKFAIKVLLPEMLQSPEVLARFEREARAAAKIKHRNVVAATDFGQTDDGAFFLVLEYVEGANLRDLLLLGRVEIPRALRILRDIATALDRAHTLEIVHRDLKPENVMLVKDPDDPYGETIKVLDFGIAKVPTMFSGDAKEASTQRGLVYGTPEYMSPEQALGEDVDARADLYAMGVMAYELFTGTRPFRQDSKVALLGMQVTAPFPPFAERAPELRISEEVETLVRRLMEKKKEDRFPDAKSVRAEIERLLGEFGGATSSHRLGSGPEFISPIARGSHVRAFINTRILPLVDRARAFAKRRPRETFGAIGALTLVAVLLLAFGGSGRKGEVPKLVKRPLHLAASTKEAEVDLDKPMGDPKTEFKAAVDSKNGKRGAEAARAWLAKEPAIAGDAEFLSGLRVLGTTGSAAALLPILETSLGAVGIDILHDLAFAEPALPIAARAKASLEKRDVRIKASPDVDTALLIRKASSCDAKKKLLPQAKAVGAARTLRALQPLQANNGCSGFAGSVRDCWPCLRSGKALNEAVAAARERAAK